MVNININGQILEDVHLVIFDRDGTLIDLYTYWSWMISKRAGLLCERLELDNQHRQGLISAMGIDATRQRIKPQGPVGLKKREVVMQAAIDYLASRGISGSMNSCIEAFGETDAISLNNLSGIVRPISGLYKLYEDLLSKSCKIAIATTDKTHRAKLVMDFLDLTSKTDLIVGEDSVSKPKPSPEMIEYILETLKIDRGKAIMVGDAVSDMRMGKNANLRSCLAVLTGISDKQMLKEHSDYLIDDISAIKIE